VVAWLLAGRGHRVSLVCRDADSAASINTRHVNTVYQPTLQLPANLLAFSNLQEALGESQAVYLAVPGMYLRAAVQAELQVWRQWATDGHSSRVLCTCTKGLLVDPVERIDAWLAGQLPEVQLVHLSGPNLAAEIAAGQPAAAVAAAANTAAGQDAARLIQGQLNSSQYRVYTGNDVIAVETAGFYKNVLAIAAGLLQGLGLGANTHAVLLTRGLAEMSRLTQHLGGHAVTLLGLAGVGDVIATCGSRLSRNFRTGLRLAQGETLESILAIDDQVAEGIQASLALERWPLELQRSGDPLSSEWPELPIARQVYRVVHESVEPRQALDLLMSRPPRQEGQGPVGY